MDDILGLMDAPYSERSGDGTAAQIIRMMLQRRAMEKQERSLRFQAESHQKNKDVALPPELKQQQQMAPQPPVEQEAPMGDIGALL